MMDPMRSPEPSGNGHRNGANGNGNGNTKGRYDPQLTPSPSKYRRKSNSRRNFLLCTITLLLMGVLYLYLDYNASQRIIEMAGLRKQQGDKATARAVSTRTFSMPPTAGGGE